MFVERNWDQSILCGVEKGGGGLSLMAMVMEMVMVMVLAMVVHTIDRVARLSNFSVLPQNNFGISQTDYTLYIYYMFVFTTPNYAFITGKTLPFRLRFLNDKHLYSILNSHTIHHFPSGYEHTLRYIEQFNLYSN